ncbi:hypothetical protein M2277_004930 [Paenibacillus sp. LBL]|uniref:SPRY domain-containing protein n=1 Tax=Paenibacillus sp. LBL TaxID=2940563 RepID=UPI0024760ED2|nr:SPRY domain-containing protein [Paenibacillus sp. LBL]MDH6674238.1 hypothetical protein [Paenibacillus sp. LBL]
MTIVKVVLDPTTASAGNQLSNGGLTVTTTVSSGHIIATHGKTSGKYYWEVSLVSGAITNGQVGIGNRAFLDIAYRKTRGIGGFSPVAGDIIGVALDMDNYTIRYHKNGTEMFFDTENFDYFGEVYPYLGSNSTATKTFTINFGSTTFRFSPPEGYEPYVNYHVRKVLFSPNDKEYISFPSASKFDVIPKMTSNTAPLGIAFGDASSTIAWYAFNKSETPRYSTTNFSSGYVGYEFVDPILIGKYDLNVALDKTLKDRFPKSWRFEGSNNLTDWTVLDRQTNIIWEDEVNTKSFYLNNVDKFKAYRIYVTEHHGGISMLISNLKMYEYKEKKMVKIDHLNEDVFLRCGMGGDIYPVSVNGIKEITSKKNILGSGSTFEHVVDLGERKTNKITFQ